MKIYRPLLLLLFLCGLFLPVVKGQPSCVSINAGNDQTICLNQCATVNATITGSRATTSYLVGAIPYTPYSYTGGNPVLVNLDDVYSAVIPLPFCFEFYGNVYNQLVIGTNGIVTFDMAQANGNCPWTINTAAPNPALPLNCIMAPFHDIDPTIPTASGQTSINWNVYGASPCREFVVNWNDIAMYGNGCSQLTSTSQLVLHETTNMVDVFIRNKQVCATWNGGAAIEGIQNATGTAATIVNGRNFPTQWTTSNDGIRFSPAGNPYYGIQWLDPSGNIVGNSSQLVVCPTQTTTYTLQFTNPSCSAGPITLSDQVTINVLQTTLTATSTYTAPLCFGVCDGTITINPNGIAPYGFAWTPPTNGGPTATGLCAGFYNCMVTDAQGCAVNVGVNLVTPPPFNASLSTTPTACSSSTGTASVSVIGGVGPFTYLWNTGDTTSSVTGLGPGITSVIVIDSAGCPDTLFTQILMNGLQVTSLQTPVLCNGDCNATATIVPQSGVPPYSFQWSPQVSVSDTASGLCSGNYSVLVTDSMGCQSTYTMSIASPAPLVLTPSSNITICLGQSTQIIADVNGGTAPYTFNWSHNLPNNDTNQIAPSVTTIYTVVVTDANGCMSQPQQTLVKVVDVPDAAFSSVSGACPPQTLWFNNLTDSAVTYFWNFGDPASGSDDTSSAFAPSHTFNTGGDFTITLIATNMYGCSDTLVVYGGASLLNSPDAGISPGVNFLTTLDPTTLFYNQTTGGNYYYIDFGDGDTLSTSSYGPYSHTYDSVGVYHVMIVSWSSDGCPDTAWTWLTVEDPTSCYVPNSFTPNGDGVNDEFMAYGVNVSEFELLIFDRWGNLIFSTTDINHGWNGTYKENKCQEDVYVWHLKYTDIFHNRYEKIGHVSLVR